MGEATPRLRLPFLIPGQAQKEVFHNEALAIVDAAVAPAVEAALGVPPTDPEEGRCWLVAAGAEGAWAGRTHSLACWTSGGWRFVAPLPGMLVWSKPSRLWIYWTGDAWSGGELPVARLTIAGNQIVGPRLSAVLNPSGGTIIDAECRVAVGALIATLKSHGLID